MAVIKWNSPANPPSGNFASAGFWLPARVPGAHDVAVIDQAGHYDVIINGGSLTAVATYTVLGMRIIPPATTNVNVRLGNTFGHTTLDVTGHLRNDATISIANGTLNAASATNYGAMNLGDTIRGGVFSVSDYLINHGNITTNVLGTIDVTGNLYNSGSITTQSRGSQLKVHGDVVNDGRLSLNMNDTGQVAHVYGELRNHAHGNVTVHDTGAPFDIDGKVINYGSVSALGSGTIHMHDGLVNHGTAEAFVRGAALHIDGAVRNVGGGLILADLTGIVTIGGATRNEGTLHATGGGSIHLEDTVRNFGGGLILADQAGSTVTIDGDVINELGATIKAGQSATVELMGAVRNASDLIADDGTLKIDGALNGQGATMIVDAGIVDLGAAAFAHVGFSGATAGELILHDTSDFHGNITGFADTDMIDFKDFLFGSTSVDYKPNAGNTGGRLMLTDQTDPNHAVVVHFVGAYSDSNFASANDGSGHLLIQHQV